MPKTFDIEIAALNTHLRTHRHLATTAVEYCTLLVVGRVLVAMPRYGLTALICCIGHRSILLVCVPLYAVSATDSLHGPVVMFIRGSSRAPTVLMCTNRRLF